MSTVQDPGSSHVMARSTSVGGNRPRLMKACREVEGLFLTRLLDAMDRPVFGGGVLGNSNASAVFRARRNQAIADEMGLRGELGLADMLYEDLTNRADTDRPEADAVPAPGGSDQ